MSDRRRCFNRWQSEFHREIWVNEPYARTKQKLLTIKAVNVFISIGMLVTISKLKKNQIDLTHSNDSISNASQRNLLSLDTQWNAKSLEIIWVWQLRCEKNNRINQKLYLKEWSCDKTFKIYYISNELQCSLTTTFLFVYWLKILLYFRYVNVIIIPGDFIRCGRCTVSTMGRSRCRRSNKEWTYMARFYFL